MPTHSSAWVKTFQSTPTITGRRIRSANWTCRSVSCFNPRPPLLVGESACAWCAAGKSWFQSTPTITGRRICGTPASRWLSSMFQSTPTITGRRIRQQPLLLPRQQSFNPRPPLLVGESFEMVATRDDKSVSIHAHHYW